MKTSPANAAFPLILIIGGLSICAYCENPHSGPKAPGKKQGQHLPKTLEQTQASDTNPQTSGGGQQDLEALINTLQSPFKDEFQKAFKNPTTVNNRVKLMFGGNEGTVVHIAAKEDNIAVLEALLQLSHKPNLEIEDDVGHGNRTVLQAAVQEDAHRAVPLLIKAGADPKKALWPIVRYKKPSMIATLAAVGVDFTQYDADDANLRFAVIHNDVETVRSLLDAGVNINTKAPTASLLDNVIYTPDQKPMFDLLLARGADVSKRDMQKNTLLHTAAQCGPQETITALVQRIGVDPLNLKGETPLFLAATRGHVVGVQTLLAHGANVNQARNDGDTPLAIAKRLKKTEVISLLEAAGGH